MKQTAVEWLEKEFNDIFYVAEDSEMAKRFESIFEQAKQMQAEQNKIPELSDEEIERQSQYWSITTNHDIWTFKLAYQAGARWYREQLKSKP